MECVISNDALEFLRSTGVPIKGSKVYNIKIEPINFDAKEDIKTIAGKIKTKMTRDEHGSGCI